MSTTRENSFHENLDRDQGIHSVQTEILPPGFKQVNMF